MTEIEVKNSFDYLNIVIQDKKVKEAQLSQVYALLDALELNKTDAQERLQREEAQMYLATNKDGITQDNFSLVCHLRLNLENLRFTLKALDSDQADLFSERDELLKAIRFDEAEIERITKALEGVLEPKYDHVFGIESKVDEQKIYKGI